MMSSRQATLFMAKSEDSTIIINENILKLLKSKEPLLKDADQDNYRQLIVKDPDLFKKYGWVVHSQVLGFNETTYIGEHEYFYGEERGVRDASIEEILHITQAHGIAPLTGDGSKGGLQKRITERSLELFKDYNYDNDTGLYVYEDKDTSKDYEAKSSIWSPEAEEVCTEDDEGNETCITNPTRDDRRKAQWDRDWGGDDIGKDLDMPEQYKMGQTFSHEYFAALADTYYGMYGGFKEEYDGMNNYRYVTRITLPSDGVGFVIVKEFLPEYHQYTARIDSEKVTAYLSKYPDLKNTFKIKLSSNDNEKYTFKSQYIKNLKIIGSNALNILGNSQDNYFEGNSANNTFDGSGGTDVLKINGNKNDYLIKKLSGGVTQISGGSGGTDKIINVEYIKFSDKTISVDKI